jgi:hypothetical protein
MHPSSPLRLGAALALVGAAACADAPVPTEPLAPAVTADARAATSTTDERYVVSPLLAQINARLAASGANVRVLSAALRVDAAGWDAASSTILVANDRDRGIGAEWVKGDPRRGGRTGVTYAFGSNTSVAPTTRDADGSNVRLVSAAQQLAQVEEAVAAWRGIGCSAKPITRVTVPAGTDPDQLDELVLEQPISGTYAQPADIVESGWQLASWFRALAGGVSGNSIIGVTHFVAFVDKKGAYTDIDRNGKADLALAEIYYNDRFYWGNGAPNVVDFYSILTHETGHALGLGHFGKVFVTKSDAADGISIDDVKYAPYAMMNAVYVTGRNELAGTDNSQFCTIWASL